MGGRAGVFAFLVVATCLSAIQPELQPEPTAAPRAARPDPTVDVTFEPNVGQFGEVAAFGARGPGFALLLEPAQAVLHLPGPTPATVAMSPIGANPTPALQPADPLPGRLNVLRSADPSQWRTDVPTYGSVTYQGVYPGIDLAFHGRRGALEYDVVVAPGADPSQVKLALDGASDLRLERNGDLTITVPGGATLVQHAPVAYQDDGRRTVESRFVLDGNRIGFKVGRYDDAKPLVIDPVFTFLTYLTSSNPFDVGNAIVADAEGNTYVNGRTAFADFPTASPLQGHRGWEDSFVTKFNRHGSLVFSTYLGGSRYDEGYGIGVDASGAVFVTGFTGSDDFPVRNAVQPQRAGAPDVYDAFVAKLSASGSELLWSTYLGGPNIEEGYGLAVDGAGNVYVALGTESPNLPTKAPIQPQFGGEEDGFIAKFTPHGQVAWATYLGGTGEDEPYGIAVSPSGAVYLAGVTSSPDFPRTNALQTGLRGSHDAFVTKLRPVGDTVQYEWSTYLGGSSTEIAYDLDIDTAGAAYVTGGTSSADFPLLAPIQGTLRLGDAFVTKVRADGTALVYSTLLGGSEGDLGIGIGVDATGAAYVGGVTHSDDFPAPNAVIPFGPGAEEPFVAKLNPAGSAIVYGSSIGGDGFGFVHGVDADPAGNAYLTGRTTARDLPTTSAIRTQGPGGWVAKVAPAAPEVVVVGFTWFDDGAGPKSVPSGGTVQAFATQSRSNTRWEMVLGRAGGEAPCVIDAVALNRTVRTSSGAGLLGMTRGTVNRPPGQYDLCFRQVDGTLITAPVTLTVT